MQRLPIGRPAESPIGVGPQVVEVVVVQEVSSDWLLEGVHFHFPLYNDYETPAFFMRFPLHFFSPCFVYK